MPSGAALFERAVLLYENRRRNFQVVDAAGRLVAEAIPVHGGEGAGAFGRDFSEAYDTSAFSVQVRDPGGEVLFFLERVEGEPIIFVTGADHRMIGRITGIAGDVRGRRVSPRECFVDVNEEMLGTIVWEAQSRKGEPVHRHCDFVALDGRRVGRFERGILRLDYRFSTSMHTLMVAAPIIFHIKSGG
ncbi:MULTISPECIES: hypothetical protein [Actinomadura]|uniref:hypothetical protein n=1 Tax=Actinomadura TaxID=1988 RepID=UPI0004218CB6|nr:MULTISPECIES: hypothetical protein [Actinomadura]RSN51413.1 hypothetical protein DMH08_30695 [Actinomadura sp. WAC 06369]